MTRPKSASPTERPNGSRRDSSTPRTPLGMTAKTLNPKSAFCRGFHAGFARRADKIRKKFLREGIFGHAFGMPLNAIHPVLRRLQFHTFDDSFIAAHGYCQI